MTEMTKQGAEVFPLLIVGAGLSGLVAARRLVDHYGAPVELVDKGRGVGGRLATRRMDGDRFDHGAQYFTARDPVFRIWFKVGSTRDWPGFGRQGLRWSMADVGRMGFLVTSWTRE